MDSAPFYYGRQNAQHIAAASIHSYYEYIKNSGELQWGMDFFDSHLRVGGDDMHTGDIPIIGEFQSTPPQGRRRLCDVPADIILTISIHASAWEATAADSFHRSRIIISIHASAWEATYDTNICIELAFISIHASAWEATAALVSISVSALFQSAPPRGRRQNL